MNGSKQVKAGLGYTIGNILIKGVTFITLPVFTRLLSTSEYGNFNTYMAYEAIIAIILGLGMYSSIKNAKYDFPDKIDLYVSTLLRLTLIPLIVLCLVIVIFSNSITGFTNFSSSILFLLLFQSYGTAMLSICNARLALEYNYKKYLTFAFFYTFVGIGLSIILILTVFNTQRDYGRIVGAATPMIILACYIFIYEGKKASFQFDGKMASYALAFGIPMICHYLSQSIQSQVDRIMISKMVDTSSTGIYSFAYSVAMILQVIYYSVDNVWSVWFYEQMDKKNYSSIRPVLKKYIFIIAVLASIMLVGSKEFIMVMSSRSYWIGRNIFIPVLLGIFMLFLYTIPAGVEYYYKKTKYIAVMTAIAAVVNISLNYILIKAFGYEAAAYATMVSYAVTFLGHWFISQKILGKDRNIFNIMDFLLPFIVLCAVGFLVYLLNDYPVIKYSVSIAIYAVLFYLRRQDIKLLMKLVTQRVSK